MGSYCCLGKKLSIVKVSPDQIPDKPKVASYPLLKKDLFIGEDSETSFAQLSSPRSGKTIKWQRGDLLGQGAYSNVYQCLNIETGEFLAVKHFSLDESLLKIQRVFTITVKEIAFLKGLKHPNIVDYYQTDLSIELNSIDILLEYVAGGSLNQILKKYGPLSEDIIRNYSLQSLSGLRYLHQNGVIHMDLKSANLLITVDGNVKLTDFGSSRKFDDEPSLSIRGTPYWMSPEIVLKKGHSFSTDVWSFGCVLIEMASGRPPWSNLTKNPLEVMSLIGSSHMYPTVPDCSEDLKELISLCLHKDPAERPSINDLLNHKFHKGQ